MEEKYTAGGLSGCTALSFAGNKQLLRRFLSTYCQAAMRVFLRIATIRLQARYAVLLVAAAITLGVSCAYVATHGKPACRRFEAGACVESALVSTSWLSVGAGYP